MPYNVVLSLPSSFLVARGSDRGRCVGNWLLPPLIGYLCVHDMRHNDHTHASDAQAGHMMSDMHGSHDRHAGHSVAMFRDKFWLSFALTIPVVFWSTDVQHWLGYTAPSFPGSKFVRAILGTVVFIYGGLVFVRGAWVELADHKPGMMTLISLAIVVAFGTSLAATFGLFEIDVWWEVATLITIMVLGHWLEMRAISQARGALNALAALLPDTCPSPKFCPPMMSTGYGIAIHRQSAIALAHDRQVHTLGGRDSPTLPRSSQTSSRKPRSSPATRGAKTKASQTKALSLR